MQLKDLAFPRLNSDVAEAARDAFREGIKAAYIVSQKNRLGQVLCAACGCAWDTVTGATAALTLTDVADGREGAGYDPTLGWGSDDPNRLMLCCLRCIQMQASTENGLEVV